VCRLALASFAGFHLAVLPAAGAAFALTLEEAIATALNTHEDVRASHERTRASEATVARARSFFFPDLTLEVDYTRRSHETTRVVDGTTTTLQTRDGIEGRLRLEQTLFDARAIPLLAQARHLRAAARLDERETRRQVAFDAARAFLTVLNAEQVVRAARGRLDLAERNLDEVRVRFDAELVSSNDVTRASLETASANRELARARGIATSARLQLGYLIGTDVVDSLTAPATLLDDAKGLASRTTPFESEGLDRADLLAERARASAARSFAREPVARYLPDVTLNGLAWSTNEAGFNARSRDWSLGIGLTWPLFDGADREATLRERNALAAAAESGLRNLERSVRVECEVARVSVESEQLSLASAEDAVDSARLNAEETIQLYRQGIVRALETVDANVQLFLAEVERAGAEFALSLAFLNYRAATGLDPLPERVNP
jgi:outer membrane protein TolC